MKKLLLPALAVAMAMPAMAAVETTPYEVKAGLKCTSLYNVSRATSIDEFNADEFSKFKDKIRSIVSYKDYLVMAYSKKIAVAEDKTDDVAHLLLYNMKTGKFVKEVQLSVDGKFIQGTLCANSIGVDDFGHLWLCPLVFDSMKTPMSVYVIDDVETGATHLEASLVIPDEDKVEGVAFRHDFYDIVGDVTGKEGPSVFMTAPAKGGGTHVVGFRREQGASTWGAHMSDYGYVVQKYDDVFPAGTADWAGATMVHIVRDEEHSGSLFYVDAMSTHPILYNTSGTMMDNFSAAPDAAPTKVEGNGVYELTLNGTTYMIASDREYGTEPGVQFRINKMGEGAAFEGSETLWLVPSNGLGTISDGGSRAMAIAVKVEKDTNGLEGAYVAVARANNGYAGYLIAPEAYVPNGMGGVNDIVADDNNAPVQYYNLQGVRLDNPAKGQLVIKRQGATATKTLVK